MAMAGELRRDRAAKATLVTLNSDIFLMVYAAQVSNLVGA